MATFTNQATLQYRNTVVNSNIVTGELVEVLSVTKTPLISTYTNGSTVTYVINIINSGSAPFTGITLSDDLGQYTFVTLPTGEIELIPLTYADGSLQYYVNGVLQPTPTVTGVSPLTVTGLSIPAGGNATVIYQADVNEFAPLFAGGEIENTVTLTGGGLADQPTASAIVTAANTPALEIVKSISPIVVNDNGQITYTLTVLNYGNTATVETDNVIVTDTFNPILDPISVTYNGVAWTEGVNYTYNEATGEFSTLAGQVSVPAATYTQDPVTGAYSVTPGQATVVVTGTI